MKFKSVLRAYMRINNVQLFECSALNVCINHKSLTSFFYFNKYEMIKFTERLIICSCFLLGCCVNIFAVIWDIYRSPRIDHKRDWHWVLIECWLFFKITTERWEFSLSTIGIVRSIRYQKNSEYCPLSIIKNISLI